MSQRKAWNEAMRSAAGGSLQIPGLAQPPPNRTTRNKRREKARKAINLLSSSLHSDLVAFRIDALEEATADLEGGDVEQDEGEEEFDELEELEEYNNTISGRKSKGTGGKKRKFQSKNLEKRFKPRSLASILMEESGRTDSVLEDYLNSESRPSSSKTKGKNVIYPPRKFCPVTGLFGIYTDPKTRICYANLDALEHLRERPPPWLSYHFGSGSSTYHDTVQSLRREE